MHHSYANAVAGIFLELTNAVWPIGVTPSINLCTVSNDYLIRRKVNSNPKYLKGKKRLMEYELDNAYSRSSNSQ
jgi:hypothetical protein